ncbi:DUF1329 domain-containing protein [Opitutus sp. ER46]|uniref:DUF1329 domain-containing protein n=1 Tax=Opitutus sp. ER46 TaxID=2161864 RepID=UPI000D2F65B9|nr:DUF1329 domain-containing protein [Opitutus sp. ER46]PTX91213.1 DUF1329 domain-containing protein [Opitutus sp. ER46]
MKTLLTAACLLAVAPLATAALDEAALAKLGKELTPLGGERAANADGSIPEWTGGVKAPAGYKVGDHHPDPFADDKPLYTVTPENQGNYAGKLTAGHLALLKAYPDYKLVVYPTHRSASVPARIEEATRKIASTAHLVHDGAGVEGALIGTPFPIPQNGLEVIWNHLLRYRGDAVARYISQAAPQRNGGFSLVTFEDESWFNYHRPDVTPETLDNVIIYFKQTVTGPARLAGSILLAHETLDQVKEPRRAWTYNAGQRRVRRAPNIAYDTPGTASDGMRTTDQFDMFNGAPDRYDWELVGKKEMIVPYNSYKLHSRDVKYADILKPLHINQDLARYELHRVWVVDAKLKPGKSHQYARRTFYVDEDSWQVLAVDQYDTRGQLWRVSEAHCINYYEVPAFWSTLEVHMDLQVGRYLAIGLDNEGRMYDFSIKRTARDYSPDSLRREGVR